MDVSKVIKAVWLTLADKMFVSGEDEHKYVVLRWNSELQETTY